MIEEKSILSEKEFVVDDSNSNLNDIEKKDIKLSSSDDKKKQEFEKKEKDESLDGNENKDVLKESSQVSHKSHEKEKSDQVVHTSKHSNDKPDRNHKLDHKLDKNHVEKSVEKSKKKFDEKVVIEKIKVAVKSFFSNKYNILFLIVLFLGILLRLKFIGQESIWNDAAQHLWYSIKVTQEPLFFFDMNYLSGDYFVVQTIVAFFYLFTSDAFVAGKIVAVLFGILGIVFMYLLGGELKNKLTGLLFATLFSFNHVLWFYGVRPLADAPLTSALVVSLYLFVKLEKEKTYAWSILFLTSIVTMFLIKKQSLLFFIAYLIYLIVFKRREAIKNKALRLSWLIPVGVILFAELLGRFVLERAVLYRFLNLFGTYRGMPYGFEAFGMLEWIFTWYMIPLILLGILFVLLYKEKKYYFFIVSLFVYYLFFEIYVDNVQDRYVLPLLVLGIIFCVYAISEIASFISMLTHKKLKFVLVFVAIVLLCFNFYNLGESLISSRSDSYAGHGEIGDWIKSNVGEDDIIFAGSPRMVRAFIGREYAGPGKWDKGGKSLWYLRADEYLGRTQEDGPQDADVGRAAFEEDFTRLNQEHDVYLEIDIWEYTQPSWYWPISQESLNYFYGLGFSVVHVAERSVNTQGGMQSMPVIFILKKDKDVSGNELIDNEESESVSEVN
jgi:hypothetical protein